MYLCGFMTCMILCCSVKYALCWSMLGKGLQASICKLSYVTQAPFAGLVELFTRSFMASSTVKNRRKFFPKHGYDETSSSRSGPKLWDTVISTSAFLGWITPSCGQDNLRKCGEQEASLRWMFDSNCYNMASPWRFNLSRGPAIPSSPEATAFRG